MLRSFTFVFKLYSNLYLKDLIFLTQKLLQQYEKKIRILVKIHKSNYLFVYLDSRYKDLLTLYSNVCKCFTPGKMTTNNKNYVFTVEFLNYSK